MDETERLVITKGQERCLTVWPAVRCAEFAERIRALPAANGLVSPKAVRDHLRVLSTQGRVRQTKWTSRAEVSLPGHLREYAGLDRELAVVGADTHFEVWDAEAWRRYLEEKEPAFADLTGEVLARRSPGSGF